MHKNCEEKNIIFFKDTIVCTEHAKVSTVKLLDIMQEFSKLTSY